MAAAGLTDEVVSKAKQSRSEKKSRKAMSKLGEWTSYCTSNSSCPKINHACVAYESFEKKTKEGSVDSQHISRRDEGWIYKYPSNIFSENCYGHCDIAKDRLHNWLL